VVVDLTVRPLSTATYRVSASAEQARGVAGVIVVRGGGDDIRLTVYWGDGGLAHGPQLVVGTYRFAWPASPDGVWQLVFDNGFSLFTSKRVTLTYQLPP
jgi:hypothetical protein